MTIFELRERSKKSKEITNEQYASLEVAYVALDLDKDTFAKIVDAIGIEALTNREEYWRQLTQGHQMYRAREQYKKDVYELEIAEEENKRRRERIKHYETNVK